MRSSTLQHEERAKYKSTNIQALDLLQLDIKENALKIIVVSTLSRAYPNGELRSVCEMKWAIEIVILLSKCAEQKLTFATLCAYDTYMILQCL